MLSAKRFVALVLTGSLLASCSATGSSDNGAASNEERIAREDLGDDWPFTTDDGVIRCEGAGEVYFQSGGVVYPVNGTAQGSSDGPDIEAIWADDPYFAGTKISIHPIIERGLELCG